MTDEVHRLISSIFDHGKHNYMESEEEALSALENGLAAGLIRTSDEHKLGIYPTFRGFGWWVDEAANFGYSGTVNRISENVPDYFFEKNVVCGNVWREVQRILRKELSQESSLQSQEARREDRQNRSH